jgi:hypothetical protein
VAKVSTDSQEKQACPHEWGHGSLKGRSTSCRHGSLKGYATL